MFLLGKLKLRPRLIYRVSVCVLGGSQRSASGVIPQESSTLFAATGYLTDLELTDFRALGSTSISLHSTGSTLSALILWGRVQF